MKNLFFALSGLLLFAVGSSLHAQESSRQFGEPITADDAISYEALLRQLGDEDSLSTKVVGQVEAVCQMKGCWMNVGSEEAGSPTMIVKFKDYGFFVPMDSAGHRVVMQGYAYREVTPVDELKHLAEDAGKSKEEVDAITHPKEELKFLATGVLLLND